MFVGWRTSSGQQIPTIKSHILPRKVASKEWCLPTGTQQRKGPSPSCRMPPGHDQISADFCFPLIFFSWLPAKWAKVVLRQVTLHVGWMPTCVRHKSKQQSIFLKFSLVWSKPCGAWQLPSPLRARVGKASDYPGVLESVHVTIVKRDALLAMRLRAEPSTTP